MAQRFERQTRALGLDLGNLSPEQWAGSVIVPVAAGVARTTLIVLLIVLGSVFFLVRPNDQLLVPALRLFQERERAVVREVLHDLARRLRRFVTALAISITLVSTAGSALYLILGVPFPLALGIIMGLGELVPFLGPPIAVIPGVLVALMESPATALAVLLGWAGIQLVQSYIVWPLIVSETARLHPAAVLFGIVRPTGRVVDRAAATPARRDHLRSVGRADRQDRGGENRADDTEMVGGAAFFPTPPPHPHPAQTIPGSRSGWGWG